MDENVNPEWKRQCQGSASGRKALQEIERLQSRIKVLEAVVERLEGEVKHHQGTALAAVEDKI